MMISEPNHALCHRWLLQLDRQTTEAAPSVDCDDILVRARIRTMLEQRRSVASRSLRRSVILRGSVALASIITMTWCLTVMPIPLLLGVSVSAVPIWGILLVAAAGTLPLLARAT